KNRGITAEEVEKLRDAEINSCNDLIHYTKENSKIRGLTEDRLYEICKTAVKAGKVSGPHLLLKQTAYWKKQNFVLVKNLAKGVTKDVLEKSFRWCSGLKYAEIRKGKRYGFVYFKTKEDAQSALKMNGSCIKDQMILVKM
ncbi:FAR1 DNA binding domain, zinc finger, SWIM-type, MULE transposase domain containing protein, partial [Tanacetum coccineum]